MEKVWIYDHMVSFSFVLKKGLLIEMEGKKKTNPTTRTRRTLTLEARKQAQRED
jgi:hypothetical protein